MEAAIAALREHEYSDYRELPDEELVGLLVARYFEWDSRILKAFYFALEDANFHTFNEVVEKEIERMEQL